MRGPQWRSLGPELAAGLRSMDERGFCAAAWQPEVVAVPTSLIVHGSHYALNVSVTTLESFEQTVRDLAPTLMALKAGIERDLALSAMEA